ncbi:hypothetical protein WSM22_37900 [Cytophagales bacterium WSM2-2]|nr:hypothetical protein WSM22_37900 [Cytophagales bacterium WSM2-2]
MKSVLTGLALLLHVHALAQRSMYEEPHHKVVFTNDIVKITDLQIAPHDTTLWHTHDKASAVIFLSQSKLAIQNKGGAPVITDVAPGATVYRNYGEKPVEHKVWCADNSTFRCLVVELLKPGTTECASKVSAGEKLWTQKSLSAYEITIDGKKPLRFPKQDCPFLLVHVSGEAQLTKGKIKQTLKAGDFHFIARETNVDVSSTQSAKLILLQLSID